MIVGIGIDMVEVDRIRHMLDRYGDAFVTKVFTSAEIDFCSGKADPAQHYAVRFAAKEAALKALGTGVRRGMGLRDVTVEREPLEAPRIVLHRGAKDKAAELGITRWHVSLTHTAHNAAAYVVAEA